jgi:Nitroreductase
MGALMIFSGNKSGYLWGTFGMAVLFLMVSCAAKYQTKDRNPIEPESGAMRTTPVSNLSFLDLLSMRKPVRVFRPEQIAEDELQTVIKAASASPVGLGMFDNYRLTIVQNRKIHEKINRATSRAFNNNPMMDDALHGAPTLIIISAIPNPNPEMPGLEIATSACIADTMLFAATGLGLGSCYICSFVEGINFDPSLLKELKIMDGYKPIAGVILGYPVEPLSPRETASLIEYDRL